MRANRIFSQRNKVRKEDAVHQNEHQHKRRNKTKEQTQKRPNRKNGLVSFSERKSFEELYTMCPASFGSAKRSQKHNQLPLAKVEF